jgi:hypothetical protein
MSASNLSRIVAIGLVLFGAAIGFTRKRALRDEALSSANSRWQVTYDVQIQAGKDELGNDASLDQYVLRMALPQDSLLVRLLDEKIIDTGPQGSDRGIETSTYFGRDSGTRLRKLISTHSGTHRVSAQFALELKPVRDALLGRSPTPLSATARARFLRSNETYNWQYPAVGRRLSDAPKDASDQQLLQWIFRFCTERLTTTSDASVGDDVTTIAAYSGAGNTEATPLGRARMFVTLCRGIRRGTRTGFPARLVTGFELRQSDDAKPQLWVEVFQDNEWIPFDPTNGYARQLPDNFIPVRFGGDESELVWGAGIGVPDKTFSITRMPPPAEFLASKDRRILEIFDLTRLPLEMHKVIKLLLLLPLAALITSIFRNVVGIHTFGTFAPALLALSFIYAAWGSGVVILVAVLILGFAGRTALERLHLLMVPRLSIILTLIILGVVFFVSFLNNVDATPNSQAVLLPLVILTILIERLYVTTEEDGAAYSLQLAVGTLVVAAFCYMLLRWEDIGSMILVYPEIHLVTLAAFVGLGRYTGYRLTELWRFRDLLQSDESK